MFSPKKESLYPNQQESNLPFDRPESELSEVWFGWVKGTGGRCGEHIEYRWNSGKGDGGVKARVEVRQWWQRWRRRRVVKKRGRDKEEATEMKKKKESKGDRKEEWS